MKPHIAAFVLGSQHNLKMVFPPEVHQQSICKRICLFKHQLTKNIPHHIVILWVGVSCSPIGEYPAFQINIIACSFQADVCQATQCPDPEDHNINLHYYGNLKTHCFRDNTHLCFTDTLLLALSDMPSL
jgi:hypothetical protein